MVAWPDLRTPGTSAHAALAQEAFPLEGILQFRVRGCGLWLPGEVQSRIACFPSPQKGNTNVRSLLCSNMLRNSFGHPDMGD